LDEPLTGLDEASQEAVLDALDRLTRGRTVVVISHQPFIARRADAVVLLDNGRVVPEGSSAEVVEIEPRLQQPRRVAEQVGRRRWS
jgi:ABC-type bacteriocin/lantibiotic exporter with double-glycine peptidase domain